MLKKQDNTELRTAREILVRGANSIGVRLSHQQIEAFSTFLSLLLYWNSRLNLTSIRDPTLIVRRHFLDSIAIAPFLHPDSRIMDVGSGAGFPGIPLKIAFPGKEVILIESRRKKANFLREVIRSLRMKGIQVLEARLERIEPQEIGPVRDIVTRAFGSLDHYLKTSCTFLSPGGRLFIMHGPKGRELLRDLGKTWNDLGFEKIRLETYVLPIGNEKRTLLIFSTDDSST